MPTPWSILPVVLLLTEQIGWSVSDLLGVGVAVDPSWLGHHEPFLGSVPVYILINRLYENKQKDAYGICR